MLNEQQFDLFSQIQTSQIGHQPYSDTFPMQNALRLDKAHVLVG